MADAQIQQGAIVALVDYDSGGNAQVEQGNLLALVSFTPPQTNAQIEQATLFALVRRYKKIAYGELGPSMSINITAPFNEIPYPWRA